MIAAYRSIPPAAVLALVEERERREAGWDWKQWRIVRWEMSRCEVRTGLGRGSPPSRLPRLASEPERGPRIGVASRVVAGFYLVVRADAELRVPALPITRCSCRSASNRRS